MQARIIKSTLAIVIMAILVAGSYFSSNIQAVTNQEFFSYHVRDLVNFAAGDRSKAFQMREGSYEESLDGPLFGVAKGRNLIVVQLESFQNFLINRSYNGVELTPNLNSLIEKDSIYFDNFYMQVALGNTSDAEFAINNSMYGAVVYCTYSLYEKNHFRGLPILLKEIGYDVAAFHGYKKEFWNRDKAYDTMGFPEFYSRDDYKYKEKLGFGIRDDEFFVQSVDYMKKMKQPFYSFLVTLSSHHPYPSPEGMEKLPLKEGDKADIVYDYLNSTHFTDACLGDLFDELKKQGLYDNSVIVLYGDHYGLSVEDNEIQKSMTELLGEEYTVDLMANIPMIIHIPGEEVTQTVSLSGGQMDFLPTISYLMGFNSLDTLYLGQNLMTADSGFVAESIYFPTGSFIRDDVVYVMSKDNVFENGKAWNRKTKQPVDLETCRYDSKRSIDVFQRSQYYLRYDLIAQLLGEKPNAPNMKPYKQPEEEEDEDFMKQDVAEQPEFVDAPADAD